MKNKLREKAIRLRKKGYSYSEILRHVHVARSTLSLWLRSIGMSNRQKQRLTEKKLASIKRGWKKWKNTRINITEEIIKLAQKDVEKIKNTNEKFWLMGTMLYWAEGAKSKEYRPSQNISFSNSDPLMIKIFLLWLKKILVIPDNLIKFDIYIHETHKNKNGQTRRYWARVTGYSEAKFDKIYYKKNKINTKRKNVGEDYHGLIRVQVRRSTNLNRKISGWIKGICKKWGVV